MTHKFKYNLHEAIINDKFVHSTINLALFISIVQSCHIHGAVVAILNQYYVLQDIIMDK